MKNLISLSRRSPFSNGKNNPSFFSNRMFMLNAWEKNYSLITHIQPLSVSRYFIHVLVAETAGKYLV
jgi:hypothetical protein